MENKEYLNYRSNKKYSDWQQHQEKAEKSKMPKMLQLGTEYKAHNKSQESGSFPFQGSIFLPVKDIMCFSSVGTPENPDNHPVLAK